MRNVVFVMVIIHKKMFSFLYKWKAKNKILTALELRHSL
jgi:hypothetical protein